MTLTEAIKKDIEKDGIERIDKKAVKNVIENIERDMPLMFPEKRTQAQNDIEFLKTLL